MVERAGPLRIGVLALQGDFVLHARALARCGETSGVAVEVVEVRKPEQLEGLDGLVMPGGESTTLLKLMDAWGFVPALEKFHAGGKPIFGTCAGLILLAREVTSPSQFSLGLIDVGVERNAYGRQRESFEAALAVDGLDARFPGVFIRAPVVDRVGEAVEVLATHDGHPVLLRQGTIWAATFHPELSGDLRVHQRFLTAPKEQT
jgi:pyridoxal 5'-phosphate synthase pdxT subunit